MGLNVSKGNMYEFVTHTWNAIKGKCPHGCIYCYCKQWGPQKPPHFDEKELKEFDRDMKKYGEGQFIFVGSSIDMFADGLPGEWVVKTLEHCSKYDNHYLFQSKNPEAFTGWGAMMPEKIALCTTIESDIFYPDIMVNAPTPAERVYAFSDIPDSVDKYITVEPIMKFNLHAMVHGIRRCRPIQVNIGADSKRKNLPEPSSDEIKRLIDELEHYTTVHQKSNLKRLL